MIILFEVSLEAVLKQRLISIVNFDKVNIDLSYGEKARHSSNKMDDLGQCYYPPF